jgi:hypothetical protein
VPVTLQSRSQQLSSSNGILEGLWSCCCTDGSLCQLIGWDVGTQECRHRVLQGRCEASECTAARVHGVKAQCVATPVVWQQLVGAGSTAGRCIAYMKMPGSAGDEVQ